MLAFTPATCWDTFRDLSVEKLVFFKVGIVAAIEDDPYDRLLFLNFVLLNIKGDPRHTSTYKNIIYKIINNK